MAKQVGQPLAVVAVSAHMDDWCLGMGGAALRAARHGHRVTIVQAVSTYGAWPVVSGRGDEIRPLLEGIAKSAGVSLLTLGHDYMRLENTPALVQELSQVMNDVRPDILFCHAEDDSNQDHVVAGQAARIAAMHAACFLDPSVGYAPPNEIYRFTTGVQTRNFAPDTFLDVGEEVVEVVGWLQAIDEMYYESQSMPGGPARLTVVDHDFGDREMVVTTHGMAKLAACITYGFRCGVKYAEGYDSYLEAHVGGALLGEIDASLATA